MIQTTLKMCTYFQCKLKISTFNKNVLDFCTQKFSLLLFKFCLGNAGVMCPKSRLFIANLISIAGNEKM